MSRSTTLILTAVLWSTAAPSDAGAQARYPFMGRFLPGHGLAFEKENQTAPRENAAGTHHARSAPRDTTLTAYDAPDSTSTLGHAINANGSVVGEYTGTDGHTHAYLRAPDGSITEYNVGTNPTDGNGLSDKDSETGEYLQDGTVHPYIRKRSGRIVTFELPDSQFASCQAINNRGAATGFYADSNGLWHSFIRARDGALTIFEDPNAATGSGQGTQAGDINVHGDVTGPYMDANGIMHGYIRHKNGTFTDFDVQGAVDTVPFTVNAGGWDIGFSDDANGVTHGFIRNPNGTITAVDAPDAGTGPGQGTIVNGVNDDGVATGNYIDASGVSHGFVFYPDGSITEFDGPDAGPGGTIPIAINEEGTISGYVYDENDVAHGLIGTP